MEVIWFKVTYGRQHQLPWFLVKKIRQVQTAVNLQSAAATYTTPRSSFS